MSMAARNAASSAAGMGAPQGAGCDDAENRLHVQKAVMALTMRG